MEKIWVIATNTLRETIRQRVFFNIFIFGIGMVVFAMVVSNITFGFPDRVVRSMGLSGVSIATNLLALLVGVGLIHREIDRKTLYVVLTRPIERWQYVLGRFCGLAMTLSLVALGFSAVFFLVLVSVAGSPSAQDVVALLMALVEALVLGAFALVLSSFSTPTLSAGIGLGFWIACASTDDLVNLTKDADWAVQTLAQGISFALPAFARFNYREAAVYGDALELGLVIWTFFYGLLYFSGFVALAGLVLERRQLT